MNLKDGVFIDMISNILEKEFIASNIYVVNSMIIGK